MLELARHDHRPQRARRIELGAGQRPAHDDAEGYAHTDRERREIAGTAGDGSIEHRREQEEGEQSLDGEASRRRDGDGGYGAERQVGASAGVPRPVATPPSTADNASAAATAPTTWATM